LLATRTARMKVLMSLMGTTRPMRHITSGGCAGRRARVAAKGGTLIPLAMQHVVMGLAPSAICRRRLVSYSAMTGSAAS
jgi:aromatic ring-opening dioxygenase LigB subunit